MKFKVLILTILAIVAILIPTVGALAAPADFWVGTATGIEVVDACAVYSDAGCTVLVASGQTFPVTTISKVGDTYTVNLWVKNASSTIDYTVTPTIICSTPGAITFTGAVAKPILKSGGITPFTFVATAVTPGTYNVQLTFAHN
jgi:hypothetical protein